MVNLQFSFSRCSVIFSSFILNINTLSLTKAVDMGHVWPKTGIDTGLHMVHMWARNGVDMGYNTPYHSHTLHCYCSRLWKI